GDTGSRLRVGQREVRYVFAHRCVQPQLAAGDQAHGCGCREGFGSGTDLEQGVCRDRQRVIDAGDTMREEVLLSVEDDTDGDTRTWELLGCLCGSLIQPRRHGLQCNRLSPGLCAKCSSHTWSAVPTGA